MASFGLPDSESVAIGLFNRLVRGTVVGQSSAVDFIGIAGLENSPRRLGRLFALRVR